MSISELSRRERAVAELLATGLSNREIGARLYISEDTVKSHVRRILSKLGVHNRAAAAVAITNSHDARNLARREARTAALAPVLALADHLENVARHYRHAAPGTHDAGARNAHIAIARLIREACAQTAPQSIAAA